MTRIDALQSAMYLFFGIIGSSVLYSLVRAMFALRSKVRARMLLESDEQVWPLRIRLMKSQQIDPEELASLLKIIESKVTTLPHGDRKIISKGLHQSNKVGAERFLKEVVGVGAVANNS